VAFGFAAFERVCVRGRRLVDPRARSRGRVSSTDLQEIAASRRKGRDAGQGNQEFQGTGVHADQGD